MYKSKYVISNNESKYEIVKNESKYVISNNESKDEIVKNESNSSIKEFEQDNQNSEVNYEKVLCNNSVFNFILNGSQAISLILNIITLLSQRNLYSILFTSAIIFIIYIFNINCYYFYDIINSIVSILTIKNIYKIKQPQIHLI